MKNFYIFFLFSTMFISTTNVYSEEKCIFISVGQLDAFWSSITKGAKLAAKNFGYKIYERSVSRVEGIESLKKQKIVLDWNVKTLQCEGILIAPGDFSLSNKISELAKKGFKTVYVDRSDNNQHIVGSIKTNNKAAGAFAADFMSKKLGSGKSVLIFRETKGVETTEDRALSFSKRAKKLGLKSIDAGYVGEVYGNIKVISKQLLKKHPDIHGIFTPNESITSAVSQTIKDLNRENIIHIGFDINRNIFKNIKSGILHATVLQDPFNMGYEGVNILNKAIKGNHKQQHIYSDFHLVTGENLNQVKIINMIKSYGVKTLRE